MTVCVAATCFLQHRTSLARPTFSAPSSSHIQLVGSTRQVLIKEAAGAPGPLGVAEWKEVPAALAPPADTATVK